MLHVFAATGSCGCLWVPPSHHIRNANPDSKPQTPTLALALTATVTTTLHRHTSRFLVIYVTFMPFTLWSACGWGAVPASVIIAFLLLGIEEIGVQIEEPFGILPLGALSRPQHPGRIRLCLRGFGASCDQSPTPRCHCVDGCGLRVSTSKVQCYALRGHQKPGPHALLIVATQGRNDQPLCHSGCAEKICDTIEANVTSLVEDRYEMSSMVDGLAGKSGSRTRCVFFSRLSRGLNSFHEKESGTMNTIRIVKGASKYLHSQIETCFAPISLACSTLMWARPHAAAVCWA